MVDIREIGYYEVCHPYHMSKQVIGYWNGDWWTFDDAGGHIFEDDDLNWIKEERIDNE